MSGHYNIIGETDVKRLSKQKFIGDHMSKGCNIEDIGELM